MASCSPITSYNYPCRINQGGIKAVYLGLYNGNSMTFTYGTGASASQITALGGATVSFNTIAQRIETGSATYTKEYAANGVTSTTHTIEITVEILDAAMTTWINIIDQGEWRAIVLDNLGQYTMYGVQNGVSTSANTGGPGKAVTDGNKAVITLTGKDRYLPAPMTSAAALSVIA